MSVLVDNLKKVDFIYFGKWVAPTLAWSLGNRWGNGRLLQEFNLKTRSELVVLDGHGFYTAAGLRDIMKLFEGPAQKFDKTFFDKFLTLTDDTFAGFVALLDMEPPANVRERLATFFERYEEVWCPWMTAFFASKTIEDQLAARAQQHGLNPQEVLDAVRPFRKNLSGIAKDEMWALKQAGGEAEPQVAAYIQKWEWIGTHHFWGDPLTRERFDEEIPTLSLQNTAPDYSGYPEDVRFLLEQAGVMSWIRTQSAELSAMVSYKLRPTLFYPAAKVLGIEYGDLIFMHQREILACLDGKPVDKTALAQRQQMWGGYFSPEVMEMFSRDDTQKLMETFVPVVDKTVTEVRGTVASKGTARGRARVVFLPHEVADFKAGDILIAPETAPDYLPLMHKSAAIVTDRGGITSHAAITSRELGKPCVIGTQIASEIFKDGDMVEVDAIKGIVRKI